MYAYHSGSLLYSSFCIRSLSNLRFSCTSSRCLHQLTSAKTRSDASHVHSLKFCVCECVPHLVTQSTAVCVIPLHHRGTPQLQRQSWDQPSALLTLACLQTTLQCKPDVCSCGWVLLGGSQHRRVLLHSMMGPGQRRVGTCLATTATEGVPNPFRLDRPGSIMTLTHGWTVGDCCHR